MAAMDGIDAINGKEGSLSVTIDGVVTELGMCKLAKGTIEKIKKEIKAVGARMTRHKTVGMKGTGEMTLHTMYPEFKKKLKEYLNTGVDLYFDVTILIEDPASPAGKQVVTLTNCNLDSVVLAELNAEDETLEDELPFTFEGWDIPQEFNSGVAVG